MKEPSGTLKGKAILRSYFAKALARVPDLRFDLVDVLVGVASITIYYRSVFEQMAAEVMIFNEQGEVAKVTVHYNEA